MHILIATGGSGHSDLAVQLGNAFVDAVGGDAVLLNVVRHEQDREHGKSLVKRAARLWAPYLPPPKVKVRVGEAAPEIIAEAHEGRYQLIVVGERVHHRILSRLLSPTAERVIAQAPCPVLVAKALTREFRNILVCDSGADQQPLIGRFTAALPELLSPGADITVLHVMSQMGAAPGVRGWQLRADAESLMEARTPEGELLFHDLKLLHNSSAHSEAKIRHGRVVDEILAEAENDAYDLVVIGTHRAEGWQRLLLDDIARQIIHDVQRPILVVQQHK
ncbi:MAG TPA: universal stress protein [Candidatus Binatia bacterium]|jgi:nucleotide-binding universal stress UspA family protein|nr:universal stress protein [Candidatus Binatia bacterium]